VTVSQTSGTPNPFTCAEFEACFDQYVDETLDAAMMNSCSCHIASCRPCDKEVTRWQQTRILLSTAVADLSTAVDVSSVRSDVFAALGFAEDAAPRRQSATREAAFDRSAAKRSAGRPARRAGSGERHSVFAAALRFTSAATVSAVAAAFAVMVLSPTQVQQGDTPPGVAPARMASASGAATWMPTGKMFKVAPVSYSPPPLAKPEVSHVDGLEPAPGHQASTWVQPRTNARVIWVEERGLGAPVRMAGLSR
jgi:hypothetical protein